MDSIIILKIFFAKEIKLNEQNLFSGDVDVLNQECKVELVYEYLV